MARPQMTGHCATPQTADPKVSHKRCERHGAGSRANPRKEFLPCPCPCHLGDTFECGHCGRPIRSTALWLGTGEETYVHVDKDGRALGEDC